MVRLVFPVSHVAGATPLCTCYKKGAELVRRRPSSPSFKTTASLSRIKSTKTASRLRIALFQLHLFDTINQIGKTLYSILTANSSRCLPFQPRVPSPSLPGVSEELPVCLSYPIPSASSLPPFPSSSYNIHLQSYLSRISSSLFPYLADRLPSSRCILCSRHRPPPLPHPWRRRAISSTSRSMGTTMESWLCGRDTSCVSTCGESGAWYQERC